MIQPTFVDVSSDSAQNRIKASVTFLLSILLNFMQELFYI